MWSLASAREGKKKAGKGRAGGAGAGVLCGWFVMSFGVRRVGGGRGKIEKKGKADRRCRITRIYAEPASINRAVPRELAPNACGIEQGEWAAAREGFWRTTNGLG